MCFVTSVWCSAPITFYFCLNYCRMVQNNFRILLPLFLFCRNYLGYILNFSCSIRSVWDIIKIFVFCSKYLVFCTNYFCYVRNILELCEVFLNFTRIIFCFAATNLEFLIFLYSIKSIWDVVRMFVLCSKYFCSKPTIFHSFKTISEVSKVFLYFVGIIFVGTIWIMFGFCIP